MKNKFWKRILSLTLAGCMGLSMLTGCGSDGENGEKKKGTKQVWRE